MSALAAVYHRTGARADEDQTQKMLRTLADYGPGRPASHANGCVSLGAAQYIDTPKRGIPLNLVCRRTIALSLYSTSGWIIAVT
jgi:hypothetical protein